MSPFICEGDVVLVDLDQNLPEHIVDGKTFAIREDHTIKIKRLVRQGGDLIIRSQDSANFPDYVASQDDFQLIGRVLWVGHEVR
jgi:phage repressor protein C with HTH and peptisase S24 domain